MKFGDVSGVLVNLRVCRACHRTVWAVTGWLLLACGAAIAQPPGWSFAQPIAVAENSGAALNAYQLRLTIDTATLVARGALKPDGSDLRFGSDEAGSTLFSHYVESGMNTPATVVWVKLDTLPASATRLIFLYCGNPGAASTSTLDVFDFADQLTNSATAQVSGGGISGVGNSQRGFRFAPTEDILVTQFGKNEPTGSTRYITLFDFASQAILAQTQVAGPAAQYAYGDLAQPVWLTQGTQYLIEIYQDTTDAYYFGAAPQTAAQLQYYDMRYCNGCTQNTFPTNSLGGMHYGYVDFEFRTRKHAAVEPSFTLQPASSATTLGSDNPGPHYREAITLSASVQSMFAPSGAVAFYDSDGITLVGGCINPALLSGAVATCNTASLDAGTHQITARYLGDALNAASSSAPFTQTVARASTYSLLDTPCNDLFVGGQTFTVRATVNGINATGSVTFLADNNVPLCVNVLAPGGVATCTTLALDTHSANPYESHNLFAQYSGNSNYYPSVVSTALPVFTLNAADVVFRNAFEDIAPGCPLQ